MSNIGILGGTFNPIHQGHLMLAKKSFEQFTLDRILVMPNHMPAYKDTDELLDANHRSEMVRLAIQDIPYLEFSDMELHRAGATYTIDTLLDLHHTHPNDKFYFIVGADSLVELDKWYRYRDILKLAALICAKRTGTADSQLREAKSAWIVQVPEAEIYFLEMPKMDISSTDIREGLSRDDSLHIWLPDAVYAYICRHHLYHCR